MCQKQFHEARFLSSQKGKRREVARQHRRIVPRDLGLSAQQLG